MKDSKGFTLVEILIALAIFSIMAAITSSVLYSVFNAHDKTTKQAITISKMQIAFVLIERDLSQILYKPIKTSLGKENSVIGLEDEVTFSRGGFNNPLAEKKQSSLIRIAYYLKNQKLKRSSYSAVNLENTANKQVDTLLEGVSQLQFHYIDENRIAKTQWYDKKLPTAIRITIHSSHFGDLSQIYTLNQSRHYYAKNKQYKM